MSIQMKNKTKWKSRFATTSSGTGQLGTGQMRQKIHIECTMLTFHVSEDGDWKVVVILTRVQIPNSDSLWWEKPPSMLDAPLKKGKLNLTNMLWFECIKPSLKSILTFLSRSFSDSNLSWNSNKIIRTKAPWFPLLAMGPKKNKLKLKIR